MDIGKLESVPLRDIWKKEARDFSPWLERNIDTLSERLGLSPTASPIDMLKCGSPNGILC